jgi:hypothetical protein
MEKFNEIKWHQKPNSIILLLVLFFPVGIYFMWKTKFGRKKQDG